MKIYGTLGPACADKDTLVKMINAGMNGIRLNLSHGMLDSFKDYLDALHDAERICNTKIELVIDMEGPELRIGRLEHPTCLENGAEVCLGKDIPLAESITDQLEKGMVCMVDDGKIELEAMHRSEEGFVCKVVRGGILSSRKSFAVKDHDFAVALLTENDITNLKKAKCAGVSAILQPFVRCGQDIVKVRRALDELGCSEIRILAKIEDIHGIEHADEIIDHADCVVFARGDLGNCIDMWLLPGYQKLIAKKCLAAGRPMVIATQLLASMEAAPVPTRAEMNDIYNSALDGAYGLMLTGETAAGKYPARAIEYLAKAAAQGIKDRV